MLIFNFLEEERKLNRKLLDLHNMATTHNMYESDCVKIYGGKRASEYPVGKKTDPYVSQTIF